MKLDRRKFFQLSALGGAAVSLDACSRAIPTAMPRRRRGPEGRVTTACGACSAGCGISVRSVGNNAVQIEGIDEHPVNAGGLCPRGIAEIQNLYHPERLGDPLLQGQKSSWDDALEALAGALRGASGSVVVGVGGMALADAALVNAMASAWNAKVVRVDLPFGQYPVDAMLEMLGSSAYRYDLGRSDCVLSLGSDWLQASPSAVESQRAFASIRTSALHRGYIAASSARLSTTAARADLWVPIRAGHNALFGKAIYRQLRSGDGVDLAPELGIAPGLIKSIANELSTRERPLVVSDRSDLETQRMGIALNQLLGAVNREGGLVRTEPVPGPAGQQDAWSQTFPNDLAKPVVLLLDANPAYLALPGSGWAEGLSRASFVASVSSFVDETASDAQVVLPMSTPLESKILRSGTTFSGIAFAAGGPAAVPKLYNSLDRAEIAIRLAAAAGMALPWSDGDAYLAALAEPLAATGLLEDGGFVELATPAPAPAPTPTPAPAPAPSLPAIATPQAPPPNYPLALELHTSLAFAGGQSAHLPYLHGLTDGGERELWRSVVELHPSSAKAHGIEDGQSVWVESARGKIRATARLRHGIRPDSAAMALGLGREALGYFAKGHGVNPLRIAAKTGTTFVTVRSAS